MFSKICPLLLPPGEVLSHFAGLDEKAGKALYGFQGSEVRWQRRGYNTDSD